MATRRPNVVLIVVDTLRYDRVSFLEGALPGAEDYGWAVTPAPWTLPAHVSLLTGLYPSVHGSHETSDVKWRDIAAIRNRSPTLMSRLQSIGYATYGFSANSFISTEFGFTGFDLLSNWDSNPVLPLTRLLTTLDERAAQLFTRFLDTRRARDLFSLIVHLVRNDEKALATLVTEFARITFMAMRGEFVRGKGTRQVGRFIEQAHFREPFFLFLNLLDVHEPYLSDDLLFAKGHPVVPTGQVPKSRLEEWVRAYDNQAKGLKKVLSGYFETLRQKGVLDESVVIVTSDHGQLLGEHDWAGHGVFLFDEVVKVPLLVRYPRSLNVERSERRGQISLTSVPRFILDLVQGRETDSGLYSREAFSESWGSYERVGGEGERVSEEFRMGDRRTCVFTDSGKVTYNLSTGRVEEATLTGGGGDSAVDAMARKCAGFDRLNERLRATLASR